MDSIIHGVTKSRTRLRTFTFTLPESVSFIALPVLWFSLKAHSSQPSPVHIRHYWPPLNNNQMLSHYSVKFDYHFLSPKLLYK